MNALRSSALLVLASAALLTLPAVHAQTPDAQPAPAAAAAAPATAAPAARLSIRDIYERASAAGYRDLREIEFEHGRYKVKGYDAQGARVKVYFNATTGAIEDGRRRD